MGSSASAHTYVETEVPNFRAGDHVTGVIKIYVEEAVSLTHLHLLLIGKEKTRWTVRTSRRNLLTGRTEYFTEVAKAEKKFLELSLPIWNFEGHLEKGQFTIPFGVQLPDWIPPSFRYEQDDNIKGEILYKLKAVCNDSDKLKAHKNVIWTKSLLHPAHPIGQVSGTETFYVKNCCCFGAGVTVTSAVIPKNVATFEDNMSASILVDNTKGRHNVTRISCRLVRSLRLRMQRDGGYTKMFAHIMLQRDESVQIKPGESILPHKYHSLGVFFKEAKDLWQTPTNRSILIECDYSIDIALTFDNFCGCGNYIVRLPIEVFNGDVIPNVYLTPQPQIPAQWNPMALASAPIQTHPEVQAPEDYFRERQSYTPS